MKAAEILTEEEIITLAHRKAFRYKHSTEDHSGNLYTFNKMCLLDFARNLIEKASKKKADDKQQSAQTCIRPEIEKSILK